MESIGIPQSPESRKQLTEKDIRYGILISVYIQGSVKRVADVFNVLPKDLQKLADCNIARPHVDEQDATQALEEYLLEDETIKAWVERDSDGNFVLSPAGIAEIDVLYEGLNDNPVAWHTLDTVISIVNQREK